MKASTAKYLFDILLIFLTGSTGTHRKNQPAAFFTSTERLFFACLSNIARTQMQAMQMSFFILLPSILLSGFMFPRAAMPVLIQYIGNLIPLTYYLLIIRGICLKGHRLCLSGTPGGRTAGFYLASAGTEHC